MYAQGDLPKEPKKKQCACEKRKTGYTPIEDLCKRCLIDIFVRRNDPEDRC